MLLVGMMAHPGNVSALWSVITQLRTSGRWSLKCPVGEVEQVSVLLSVDQKVIIFLISP